MKFDIQGFKNIFAPTITNLLILLILILIIVLVYLNTGKVELFETPEYSNTLLEYINNLIIQKQQQKYKNI